MKLKLDKKHISIGVTAFLVVSACILLLMLLLKFDIVINIAKKLISILMPLILGFGFAFLLNPLLNFFENTCFRRLLKKHLETNSSSKLPRIFGLIATMIVALLSVGGFIGVLVPHLTESVKGLLSRMPEYLGNAKSWLNQLILDQPWLASILGGDADELSLKLQSFFEGTTPTLQNMLSNVTGIVIGGAIGALNAVTDFILAIFVSVYMLYSKERFAAQAKKILYAICSKSFSTRLLHEARKTHKIFSGFISGKILDSIIIGILTFIVLSIVQMPYTVLISVIVGVTNVIPVFGPFIGAIPGTLILLLDDPLKALLFVVIILIIQQLDGNVIGPKILGDSTGLSAFWVLFSIILGGGMFGFVGMLLGVPTWALIYSLIKTFVEELLRKKKFPTETEDYFQAEFPSESDAIPSEEAVETE